MSFNTLESRVHSQVVSQSTWDALWAEYQTYIATLSFINQFRIEREFAKKPFAGEASGGDSEFFAGAEDFYAGSESEYAGSED